MKITWKFNEDRPLIGRNTIAPPHKDTGAIDFPISIRHFFDKYWVVMHINTCRTLSKHKTKQEAIEAADSRIRAAVGGGVWEEEPPRIPGSKQLKKFRVTKPYWYTLSAIVEAFDEDEASEKFDEVDTHDCTESYQGYLDSYDDTIAELKE